MSLSPAILAMIDAAVERHRNRRVKAKGWKSDAERRRVLVELKFFAGDIDDTSLEGRKAMLRRMDNALRAEVRNRDRMHWSYHRARHQTLLAARRAEALAVQAMPAETRYLEAAE